MKCMAAKFECPCPYNKDKTCAFSEDRRENNLERRSYTSGKVKGSVYYITFRDRRKT